MVTYKGKKIIYSLHYSGFMPKKIKIIIYVPFIALFAALLTLTICLNIDHGGFLSDTDTIAVFVMTIISLLGLSLFPITSIRKRSIERRYQLWLTDDMLVETEAKPFVSSVNYMKGTKYYIFGVKFECEGKLVVKYSNHYDRMITLYSDKPMKLLYSPRYDEVLVVEDDISE